MFKGRNVSRWTSKVLQRYDLCQQQTVSARHGSVGSAGTGASFIYGRLRWRPAADQAAHALPAMLAKSIGGPCGYFVRGILPKRSAVALYIVTGIKSRTAVDPGDHRISRERVVGSKLRRDVVQAPLFNSIDVMRDTRNERLVDRALPGPRRNWR
jgi:hypothetical protein